MKLLPLIACLGLVGCATTRCIPPQPQIVVKTQYVTRVPPAQLLTLPAPVPPLDVSKASQADVAAWILAREKYELALKADLQGIANFFASGAAP